MKESLRSSCASELIEDRLNLWDKNQENFTSDFKPKWLTLEPPKTLVCYTDLIEQDLQIEDWAIKSFCEVVQSSNSGYCEGLRILAHLLKDSATGTSWNSSPSKWLYKCSHEALDAIRNWSDWDCDHNGKGWGKGKGASSSSSSSWSSWHPSTSAAPPPPPRGFRG